MIKGSWSGSRAGYGSIPMTTGSGSCRPKNMWIRIRIMIPNTASSHLKWMNISCFTGSVGRRGALWGNYPPPSQSWCGEACLDPSRRQLERSLSFGKCTWCYFISIKCLIDPCTRIWNRIFLRYRVPDPESRIPAPYLNVA
jgi:hypothetical protein